MPISPQPRVTSRPTPCLNDALACSFVGTPATIRKGVNDFVARTGADELMIASQVFDHAARLRCFGMRQAGTQRLSGVTADLCRHGVEAARVRVGQVAQDRLALEHMPMFVGVPDRTGRGTASSVQSAP